jgi:hypothetical protein
MAASSSYGGGGHPTPQGAGGSTKKKQSRAAAALYDEEEAGARRVRFLSLHCLLILVLTISSRIDRSLPSVNPLHARNATTLFSTTTTPSLLPDVSETVSSLLALAVRAELVTERRRFPPTTKETVSSAPLPISGVSRSSSTSSTFTPSAVTSSKTSKTRRRAASSSLLLKLSIWQSSGSSRCGSGRR